jgi:DUF1009 family protein
VSGIEPKTLGVIAGNGPLPGIVLKNLKPKGLRVFMAAHKGETSQDDLALADEVLWIRPGQILRMLEFFKGHGVSSVLFAGGLKKTSLVKSFDPDEEALMLLNWLPNLHDDTILRALASWLEENGMNVLDTRIGIGDILGPKGVLSALDPSPSHEKDIVLGFKVARALGELDVGQAVVVEGQIVLALEAIEGTDAMIERVGPFCKGNGVLVKAKKPTQDLRFDLPSVGPETIRRMHKSGLRVLAYEADWTILFERENLISQADAWEMVVMGCRY